MGIDEKTSSLLDLDAQRSYGVQPAVELRSWEGTRKNRVAGYGLVYCPLLILGFSDQRTGLRYFLKKTKSQCTA